MSAVKASQAQIGVPSPAATPLCTFETAAPAQAVTGSPLFASAAPTVVAAAAGGPPQMSAESNVQPVPLAGAVNVLTPPFASPTLRAPVANRRSVPPGSASSARPPAPLQPVTTVDVPSFAPVVDGGGARIAAVPGDVQGAVLEPREAELLARVVRA